jgi:hypothetical protein
MNYRLEGALSVAQVVSWTPARSTAISRTKEQPCGHSMPSSSPLLSGAVMLLRALVGTTLSGRRHGGADNPTPDDRS